MGEEEITQASVDMEMPKYRCHKEVHALKIAKILKYPNQSRGGNRPAYISATITPEESGYADFSVDSEYIRKHDPQVGGYYMVYEDGYKSFSPAKAFEDGYTLIE